MAQEDLLAIGSGFAEVTQEKVSVLTDSAFGDDEIDEAAEEAAMKRAEEKLAKVADLNGTDLSGFLLHSSMVIFFKTVPWYCH